VFVISLYVLSSRTVASPSFSADWNSDSLPEAEPELLAGLFDKRDFYVAVGRERLRDREVDDDGVDVLVFEVLDREDVASVRAVVVLGDEPGIDEVRLDLIGAGRPGLRADTDALEVLPRRRLEVAAFAHEDRLIRLPVGVREGDRLPGGPR